MTKKELEKRMTDYKQITHDALQVIWDATNKGQRNKMLKNAEIKEILDRYGVSYEQT